MALTSLSHGPLVQVASCWPAWPLACTSLDLLGVVASETLNLGVSVEAMEKIMNWRPKANRLERLIQGGRARFPAREYPLFDHELHETVCRLQLCLQTLLRRAPMPHRLRMQEVLTLVLHCAPIHTLNLDVGKLGIYLKSEIKRGIIDWHPAVWPIGKSRLFLRVDISEYVPRLSESWMHSWMPDDRVGHELSLRALCVFLFCVVPDRAFPDFMQVLREIHEDKEVWDPDVEQWLEEQLS